MKLKSLSAAFALLSLFSFPLLAENMSPEKAYRAALQLYSDGQYSSARSLFESVDDPLCSAYALLCAARQKDPAFPAMYAAYSSKYPAPSIDAELHYRYGLILFDEGRYAEAANEFSSADGAFKPGTGDGIAMEFRAAYCDYALGRYPDAAVNFRKVVSYPYNDYTTASMYYLGYLAYKDGKYSESIEWFGKSVADKRFEELSTFYLVECHFLLKDYDYVTKEGAAAVEKMPGERSSHLSRLVSEAFLIKGDTSKAREYYEKENAASRQMTRSDYFHAGSVMYGAGDWSSAIDSFTKMGELSDSLGQIASYELGYSYIRKGNKVAAMNAFNNAASLPFSPSVKEDAAFNYAKLAFDINHDTGGFNAYLSTYSTREKGEMIYNYIAIAELYNRNYEAAIDAYGKMDSLSDQQKGNYVKANYLRAVELIKAGSWSGAVPYLKAAGFHYPRGDSFNQLSRYWLGEAYYNTGAYVDAASTFTDLYNTAALRGCRESELIPYNVAYSYLMQSNFVNASRWFDIYLSGDGAVARRDAMARRADCDFQQNNYKAAAALYRELGKAFPEEDYLYPYYREGLCLGLLGNKAAEVKVLSKVRTAPVTAQYYSEAMYELGRACLDCKDYQAAEEAFSALRSNTSDSTYVARAYIGLGMSERNRKNYDKALEDYKTVVAMMPDSEYAKDALLAIESIYQVTGQPEKYLAYVEGGRLMTGRSASEMEQIYFNTAEQVYLAGNYSKAVELLGKYDAEYPSGANRGKGAFYLAESYRMTGDRERALEWYSKVPELLPSDSFGEMSLLRCGSLSYELEKFSDAYAYYSRLDSLARMDENKKSARTGMMRSSFRAGEYEKAAEASQRVESAFAGDAGLCREAVYVRAKSLLSMSRRPEAMDLFARLSAEPSTPEGAEACYLLVQGTYDSGDFAAVEPKVYDFAAKCGSQSYWLAKCYIVLGDSFAERGNFRQAKATFESLKNGYEPSGASDDVMENVEFRLEKLESLLKN